MGEGGGYWVFYLYMTENVQICKNYLATKYFRKLLCTHLNVTGTEPRTFLSPCSSWISKTVYSIIL